MPQHSTAKDLLKDFDESNFVDGVYVFSKADNADYYDMLWEYQGTEDEGRPWGDGRISKLLDFYGGRALPLNPNPKVLDMCCGLGRFSVAALELGADFVVACDGSFAGPKFAHAMVNGGDIPRNQLLPPR